ncbi:MAG: hypothetical protein ACJAYJ_001500 [Saprospiraceae bacterium]|jgi:hypothetical protein
MRKYRERILDKNILKLIFREKAINKLRNFINDIFV